MQCALAVRGVVEGHRDTGTVLGCVGPRHVHCSGQDSSPTSRHDLHQGEYGKEGASLGQREVDANEDVTAQHTHIRE